MQALDLVQKTRRQHGVETLLRCAVQRFAIGRREHESAEAHRLDARAWVSSPQLAAGAARQRPVISSARWMRCASFGWMRAADSGSTRRELRVQRWPARRRAPAHRSPPAPPRRPRGSGASPCSSARKYSIVPPTSSGTRPRAWISTTLARASARKSPAEYDSAGSRRSIRWCGARARARGIGLRGADVHAAIHLRRIDADDLDRQLFGQAHRKTHSCRAGRTDQQHHLRHCGRRLGHRPRRNSRSSSASDSIARSVDRDCTARRARCAPCRAAARPSPAASGAVRHGRPRGRRRARAARAAETLEVMARITGIEGGHLAQHPREIEMRRAPPARAHVDASSCQSNGETGASRVEARAAASASRCGSRSCSATARAAAAPRPTSLVGGRLHAFVQHAFVPGVHVDEHQACPRLGQDVDAVQLRERLAERAIVGRERHGRIPRRRGVGSRANDPPPRLHRAHRCLRTTGAEMGRRVRRRHRCTRIRLRRMRSVRARENPALRDPPSPAAARVRGG